MLPDDMVQARKAALLVHALPAKARESVLARLSEPQRLRLQALLDELKAMKVPAERDWLRYIEDMLEAGGHDTHVMRTLQMAGARRMAQVFEQQPPEVVAAVMRAAAWAWRAEALETLPAHQRIAINALLGDERKLAAAVEQRLLALCAEAVRALPPEEPRAAASPVEAVQGRGRKSRMHSFFIF